VRSESVTGNREQGGVLVQSGVETVDRIKVRVECGAFRDQRDLGDGGGGGGGERPILVNLEKGSLRVLDTNK
jgi:hypothetical protein